MNSSQTSIETSGKICPELKREGICRATVTCGYKHDPKYLDKSVCLTEMRNEMYLLKQDMETIKTLLLKQTQATTAVLKAFQKYHDQK